MDTVKMIGAWLLTVNVFSAIKKFYGALIDLIGFIVDKTSDQGADIAIRALPIVSPLPNAISMYYVSQTALKFTDPQAKAFAIAMELALFGLFEVALKMFDGYQRDPKRYKYLLGLAVGIASGVMLLIIVVVYKVETDRPILATLPLFSAAGAAALSLRRWHNHNEQAEQVQAKDWQTRFTELKAKREAEQVRYETAIEQKAIEHAETVNQIRAEQSELIERLQVERESFMLEATRLSALLETARTASLQQERPMKQDANSEETDSRRRLVLDHYRSNPYASYQDVASALNLPKSTIYNDVQVFKKKAIVHINGNGTEVLNDY